MARSWGKIIAIGCGGTFAVLVLVAVCTALLTEGGLDSGSPREEETAEKREEEPEEEEPVFATVTAPELLGEYERNELAAARRFEDQWIVVVGVVDDIGADIIGSPYVTLGPRSGLSSVQCMLADDAVRWGEAQSAGDRVALRGRVDGKLMNVLVRDCSPVATQ